MLVQCDHSLCIGVVMKKLFFFIYLVLLTSQAYAADGIDFTLRGFAYNGPASQNPNRDFNFIAHPKHFTQLHQSEDFGTLVSGKLQEAKVYIELWRKDGKRGSQLFLDHKNLRKNILKKKLKFTRIRDNLYPGLTLFSFIAPTNTDELSFSIPRKFKEAGVTYTLTEEIDPKTNKAIPGTGGVYFLVVRFLHPGEERPSELGTDDPKTIVQVYDYEFPKKRKTTRHPTTRLTNLNAVLDEAIWAKDYFVTEEEDTEGIAKKELGLNLIFPNLKEFLATQPQLPEPGKVHDDAKSPKYLNDNEYVLWTGVTQHAETNEKGKTVKNLDKLVIRNGDILLRAGEDSQISLGLVPPPIDFDHDPLMNGLSWNDFPISPDELMKKLNPDEAEETADDESEEEGDGRLGHAKAMFSRIRGHIEDKLKDSKINELKKLALIPKIAKISVALYKATLEALRVKDTDIPDNVESSFRNLIISEISRSEPISKEEYEKRKEKGTANAFKGKDDDGKLYYYKIVDPKIVPDGVIGYEENFTYEAKKIIEDERGKYINVRVQDDEERKDDLYCRTDLRTTKDSYPLEYNPDGTVKTMGTISHYNCMPNKTINESKFELYKLFAKEIPVIGKKISGPFDVNPFHIPISMEDKIDQAVHYNPGTIFLTHVGMAVIEYDDVEINEKEFLQLTEEYKGLVANGKQEPYRLSTKVTREKDKEDVRHYYKGNKQLWIYDAYPNSDGFGGIRRTTWADFFGATKDPITKKLVVHATAGGIFRVPGKDANGKLFGVEAAKEFQLFYRTWKHRRDEKELAVIKEEKVNTWKERFKSKYESKSKNDNNWFKEKLAEVEAEELYPVEGDDPFDYGFDWTTPTRIACSEGAYRAYANIGVNIIPNLTILRMPLEGVHKLGWEVVEKFAQASPQSIMMSPRVTRVADFISHSDSESNEAKAIAHYMDEVFAADHKEKPVDISSINFEGKPVDLNKVRINEQPAFSLYPVPPDSI